MDLFSIFYSKNMLVFQKIFGVLLAYLKAIQIDLMNSYKKCQFI